MSKPLTRAAWLAAGLASAALLTSCSAGAQTDCLDESTIPERVSVAFTDNSKTTGRYGAVAGADKGSAMMAVEYIPNDSKESLIGVWFTADIPAGQVFSVDDNARNSSDWGQGSAEDSKARQDEPEYAAAISCLK